MSTPLSLTSELEAVNAILASVGESPVTTLNDEFTDASLALSLLSAETRSLQIQGWSWNTDPDVVLVPDNDGFIWLSNTVLRAKMEDPDYVRRGTQLYNRTDRTYVFTGSVTALEIVTLLPFEDIPEAARTVACYRAGRKFQDRLGGDEGSHQWLKRDELEAWVALQNDESERAQYNVLTASALVARIKGNR
jgi:hypothetical protein